MRALCGERANAFVSDRDLDFISRENGATANLRDKNLGRTVMLYSP
ncbi:hypothetical protein ACPOL_1025 [Acidisarcina polymorpha]|uniref:Uncharacterized protein n=1 Tax=Acidisarcina polymorpha TaxID=2211140 RepID=A0A2Z5FVD2_9BACT|nr:hypothetical protein ACPOL_1025 [Acidisarcina polymorpha]